MRRMTHYATSYIIDNNCMRKKFKRLLKALGPGFITGASDDDPSGISTYTQTGVKFGYQQLWLSLFSIPFMTAIQEICGRIGMVTGKGLSEIIRERYPRWILFFSVTLLLIANVVNIGADLGAMASSTQLLINIPFWIILPLIAGIILLLEIFVSYKRYSKILKYLTISLFAYVATAFIVNQSWTEILHATFIPFLSLEEHYILNIVAFLGTTISPNLFFWQASEEVEEEIAEKKLLLTKLLPPRIKFRDIAGMRIDTAVGMVFSNIISFFIVVTAAATLHAQGITNIETAEQAANALRPLAGDLTFLLFALGIIGTGFLAIPVLAGSSAYAFSDAVGWKAGLFRKFKQAHGFYGVIIFATLIGLIINFTPIKPFTMLYYAAVLNGIIAPPLMVIIMLISNNSRIMGGYKNSRTSNVLGWTITAIMSLASIFLLISIL